MLSQIESGVEFGCLVKRNVQSRVRGVGSTLCEGCGVYSRV